MLLPVDSTGNLSTPFGEMWFTGHLNPQEDACGITQKDVFPSFKTLKAAVTWRSKLYNVQQMNIIAEIILQRRPKGDELTISLDFLQAI